MSKMDTISAIGLEPIKGPIDVSADGVLTSESNATKNPDDVYQRNEKIQQKAEEVKDSTDVKISRIAEAMDSYVQSVRRDLKIQVHGDTGDIMVEVISASDGKVIREIPPKELLDLAAKMEDMTGALFNGTA